MTELEAPGPFGAPRAPAALGASARGEPHDAAEHREPGWERTPWPHRYGFEKRQRELKKEQKKEEKRQRKLDRQSAQDDGDTAETQAQEMHPRGARPGVAG